MTHEQHLRAAVDKLMVFRFSIVLAIGNAFIGFFSTRYIVAVVVTCFVIDLFQAYPSLKRNWPACDSCSKLIRQRKP